MFRRLKRILLRVGLLLLGAYCCGYALWNMGKTAIFLHESTVLTARVVDMVQCPFESYTQALEHGNLPWDGETAYRATVGFTLPTSPVAIEIPRLQLPDLDNRDYNVGQEVEIIAPLTDPARAHLYRWKFLWGADCMLLLLGLALGGTGYMLLRRRKKKAPARTAGRRLPQTGPATKAPASPAASTPQPAAAATSPARPARRKKKETQATPAAAADEFRLVADPPEPKKKRTRKPKDPNAAPAPRSGKKKSGTTSPRKRKTSAA